MCFFMFNHTPCGSLSHAQLVKSKAIIALESERLLHNLLTDVHVNLAAVSSIFTSQYLSKTTRLLSIANLDF